ncbi:hypothetical protein QTO34_006579 [Cnephaeus nilssonii]|uniref:Activator of Hsp90 ATPase AHSA1-like N-terminal domain-containing protein n=1 Tax=Cnephaeus nilssonii TaxID=3371016 RepID=A0AA40LGT8_CNENI|nr:hypothetical protein QTO34_006579 [Eptesicus nilssonii]
MIRDSVRHNDRHVTTEGPSPGRRGQHPSGPAPALDLRGRGLLAVTPSVLLLEGLQPGRPCPRLVPAVVYILANTCSLFESSHFNRSLVPLSCCPSAGAQSERVRWEGQAASQEAPTVLEDPHVRLVLCSPSGETTVGTSPWGCAGLGAGIIKESGAKHKGLIEIPNLSEENEVDDTEVNVSKKKGDGDVLKDLMKTAGTAKVREALGDYLKALKTEFTMGMILPTKATATQELSIKRKLSENTCRIPTVALHMTELFDAGVERLYSIFTVKELVQKFSKSPAILEAEKGGKFQMFDGNVTGEYIELLTNEKIVMKWRCRSWPEEHYATVVLNFVPTPGQTELQLDCKGVPVCKEENMKFCWQKQHFEEIKGVAPSSSVKTSKPTSVKGATKITPREEPKESWLNGRFTTKKEKERTNVEGLR